MSGNQYLFLFTIGPVQSFIAQARKTRDLYAGSAILGEIIGAAIDEVGKENVIIPNPELQAKPNRFLAKIISDNPQKLAGEIEEAARSKWRAIALQSFTSAGVCYAPETNNFNEEQKRRIDCTKLEQIRPAETKKQVEDFLEVYWVMLELGDGDDYKEKYDEVQKLLGAIKNTRRFNQVYEPAARKCSLDGERNALFYRTRADNGNPAYIQREAQKITTEKHLLNPGEGLSAVSLVKRFYRNKDGFPSTAKIALLHALGQIKADDEAQKVLDAYEKIFDRKGFDEQLYYEDNLTETYFINHGYDLSRLTWAREQHEKVASVFKKHNLKFLKYYAVIAFDGDDMGKVWSGNILSDTSRLEQFQSEASSRLQQFQQLLAKRLGIFAAYATAYLNGDIPEPDKLLPENDIWTQVLKDESYQRLIGRRDGESRDSYESRLALYTREKGKTVYAGGDDFLGFVNPHYLFDVMRELRFAYKTLVYEPLFLNDVYGVEKPLTFSAGAVIAHYKEPLGEVLHFVRQAERAAKEIDEQKDAFSLMVMKGSGQNVSVRYKWYQSATGAPILDKMNMVLGKLLDEERGYSNTFLKNIDRSFRPLSDNDGAYDSKSLVSVELKRLIARSSKIKNPDERKADIKKFHQDINSLYRNAVTIGNFFSCLHVCDFLNKELKNEWCN